ncbi:unnamed protein product [Adineta ricciae]|uniref:Uncharacterized protein n=1 Tax=Adineta ricciae TaxID=249248 RepID=A0A814FTN6_ADIRI|nr:unnamed protein product [Adineta ricciae]
MSRTLVYQTNKEFDKCAELLRNILSVQESRRNSKSSAIVEINRKNQQQQSQASSRLKKSNTKPIVTKLSFNKSNTNNNNNTEIGERRSSYSPTKSLLSSAGVPPTEEQALLKARLSPNKSRKHQTRSPSPTQLIHQRHTSPIKTSPSTTNKFRQKSPTSPVRRRRRTQDQQDLVRSSSCGDLPSGSFMPKQQTRCIVEQFVAHLTRIRAISKQIRARNASTVNDAEYYHLWNELESSLSSALSYANDDIQFQLSLEPLRDEIFQLRKQLQSTNVHLREFDNRRSEDQYVHMPKKFDTNHNLQYAQLLLENQELRTQCDLLQEKIDNLERTNIRLIQRLTQQDLRALAERTEWVSTDNRFLLREEILLLKQKLYHVYDDFATVLNRNHTLEMAYGEQKQQLSGYKQQFSDLKQSAKCLLFDLDKRATEEKVKRFLNNIVIGHQHPGISTSHSTFHQTHITPTKTNPSVVNSCSFLFETPHKAAAPPPTQPATNRAHVSPIAPTNKLRPKSLFVTPTVLNDAAALSKLQQNRSPTCDITTHTPSSSSTICDAESILTTSSSLQQQKKRTTLYNSLPSLNVPQTNDTIGDTHDAQGFNEDRTNTNNNNNNNESGPELDQISDLTSKMFSSGEEEEEDVGLGVSGTSTSESSIIDLFSLCFVIELMSDSEMRQLGTEEKAALLLTAADDDDHFTNERDDIPVIPKRPKTYQRRHSNSTPSVCFFFLILSAFIIGSISGVVIMLYRISQDPEQAYLSSVSSHLTRVDLTIRTKLSQSFTKSDFMNLTRQVKSESDTASKLEQLWQSSKLFTRVSKLSYDLTLSIYSPLPQWTGVQLLDKNTNVEIKKCNVLTTNDYLTFSSLVKSGRVQASYIFYVNYGRKEDFAYLIQKNQIQSENYDKTVVFMRRNFNVITQTEQIRQASRYGFAGLVLFDDPEKDPQLTTTKDRQTFLDEWERHPVGKERQQFLDGNLNEDDRPISVVLLSYTDVQNLFSYDSNDWFPCPPEWHNASSHLKLGGLLQTIKLNMITFMQEVPVHLPVVLGYIPGTSDSDRVVMIGYQLERKQQEKIVNEIIRAYANQIKNGWQPRRSILFSAWSGSAYDHHTTRQWILNNYRLLDRNLVAYIDLGHGISGNSTLNLHGSPLFQQIAQRAADFVASPLIHDHACHHRQGAMPVAHAHVHRRRRHGDEHGHQVQMNQHEEQTECEPHKLFDEWLRASKNRINANQTTNIVQMIDNDSSAALFQLKYGIPSLIIEMSEEQYIYTLTSIIFNTIHTALTNDTFYARKLPPTFNAEIQPQVIVAYTQFVSEIVRQLADEPLIPYNVTDYAILLEKQTADYLTHYDKQYHLLAAQLGDSSELTKLNNDLIKAIRQVQSRIDQISKNNYMDLQLLNNKLIEFERLFIVSDSSETYKHFFLGPAVGLTNTVVPYPMLSNLLFGLTKEPPTEIGDASKLYWSKVKQQIQLMTRTLNGVEDLLSNP